MIELSHGEKMKVVRRRHWILLKTRLAIFIPGFLMSLIGIFIIAVFGLPDQLDTVVNTVPGLDSGMASVLAMFILSLLTLFLWHAAFMAYLPYYLDTWVITDQRILHSEVLGLFSHHTYTVPLYRIQDITTRQNGILAHVLSFGDVRVQTAGNTDEVWISEVANPIQLKETIIEAKRKYRETGHTDEV